MTVLCFICHKHRVHNRFGLRCNMVYSQEQLEKCHTSNVQQRYGSYIQWLRPKLKGDDWSCAMHHKSCRHNNKCVCGEKRLSKVDWSCWGALLSDGATVQITNLLSEAPTVTVTLSDATVVNLDDTFPQCQFHIAMMRVARQVVGGAAAQKLAELCRNTMLALRPQDLAHRHGIRGTRPLWGPVWEEGVDMPGVDDADWLTWRLRFFPLDTIDAAGKFFDVTVNLWKSPTTVVFVEPDNMHRRRTAEADDANEALPFSQMVTTAYANFQREEHERSSSDTTNNNSNFINIPSGDESTVLPPAYNTRSSLANIYGYRPLAPPINVQKPELVSANRACPFPRVANPTPPEDDPELPPPQVLSEVVASVGDAMGVPHWLVAWMDTDFRDCIDVDALCNLLMRLYGEHVVQVHPIKSEGETWVRIVEEHLKIPLVRKMLGCALAAAAADADVGDGEVMAVA